MGGVASEGVFLRIGAAEDGVTGGGEEGNAEESPGR